MREKGLVHPRVGFAFASDGADGARSVIVGQGNKPATGAFFDSHLRNNRNAEAGGNHTKDAAELATFKNDMRVHMCAIAGGNRGFAEAMAVAKQKEGI